MAHRVFNMLLSATMVASALVSVGINQPALAKSKRHIAQGRGAYFVPPPPPYAPSILPETMAHIRTAEPETDEAIAIKPPENPYKKYIFTRDEGDMPRVVRGATRAQTATRVQTSRNNVITYNFHNKT